MRVWLVVESTSFGGRNGVESWCKRQPIVGGSPGMGCELWVIVETTSFGRRNVSYLPPLRSHQLRIIAKRPMAATAPITPDAATAPHVPSLGLSQ